MSNEKVRVGFVGAGAICRSRHLPGLAKLNGVEVVAVANRSRESSQAVAKDFNIPHIEEDWRKLIERDDIDAVFIGTWPYMHQEMSAAVLDAGKHVFCQARMAMDLAQAKEMAAHAKKHPTLVNMICPPPHRMPFEPFIKKVLTEGQLGKITAVELTVITGANLNPDKVTWREEARYSGKQIMAMGIMAETLNAWVGPYESLSAQLGTFIPTKKNEQGQQVQIDIPQVVTISGKLSSGALAYEHHTGLAADKSTHGTELTIYGLEGTLRYNFGKTIEMARAGEPLQAVDVPTELTRDWLVEADFIAAVRNARAGKPWHVSPDFEEGLLYMRKVEAVHEAAARGAAVKPADL